jgi:hypothetical protein
MWWNRAPTYVSWKKAGTDVTATFLCTDVSKKAGIQENISLNKQALTGDGFMQKEE